MRRTLIIAGALLLSAQTAMAQATPRWQSAAGPAPVSVLAPQGRIDWDTVNFAGLRWNMSESTVRSTLESHGYTFDSKDEDGDLKFRGNAMNYKAVVYALFTPDRRLVKTAVILITPDEEARQAYTALKNSLIAKYGNPSNDFHFFSSPYEDGDGNEVAAFKAGKATFSIYWGPYGNTRNVPVSANITKALAVAVTYEAPAWNAEAQRRRGGANSGNSGNSGGNNGGGQNGDF